MAGRASAQAPPPEKKPSMLDATLGRLDSTSRPMQPLNRICLVGRAGSGVSGEQLAEWHEKQVSEVKSMVMDMETMVTTISTTVIATMSEVMA